MVRLRKSMPTYMNPNCAGSGAVYSFDPVGSYERETCRAAGAASSLVQPFLDNQVSPRVLKYLFCSGLV
jgi:20S proteasome alpha/beta subunit